MLIHRLLNSRTLLALCGVLACLVAFTLTGRAGLASLLAAHAKVTASPEPASLAVRLDPSDPHVRQTYGSLLGLRRRFAEAVEESETAVALRPRGHVSWLMLARERERIGDIEGARRALEEAIRLAPHYARPRFLLGTLLLKQGRRDEGFASLRLATRSDPAYFVRVLDLAWREYGDDARAVGQAIEAPTPRTRLELARSFIKHGAATKAIEAFHAADDWSEHDTQTLLAELIAARRFAEAREVWSSVAGLSADERSVGTGVLLAGGFEGAVGLSKSGFGWISAHDPSEVKLSLDTEKPHEGASSLRLELSADFAPTTQVISQLVLVEPGTRYRLRFAARTGKIKSGGLPTIVVRDPHTDDRDELGRSAPLPSGGSEWQSHALEFTTAEDRRAVIISLERQPCPQMPCPIFGQLWLDGFTLEKL